MRTPETQFLTGREIQSGRKFNNFLETKSVTKARNIASFRTGT